MTVIFLITNDDFLINGDLADTSSSFVSEQEKDATSSVNSSDSSTVVAMGITSIERDEK